MDTETIEHSLRTSIKGPDGADIKDVVLREPEVGDLIAVEKAGGGDVEQLSNLLQRMSNLPPETFRRIKGRDLRLIKEKTDKKWGNPEEDGA